MIRYARKATSLFFCSFCCSFCCIPEGLNNVKLHLDSSSFVFFCLFCCIPGGLNNVKLHLYPSSVFSLSPHPFRNLSMLLVWFFTCGSLARPFPKCLAGPSRLLLLLLPPCLTFCFFYFCLFVIAVCQKRSPFRSRTNLDAAKVPFLPWWSELGASPRLHASVHPETSLTFFLSVCVFFSSFSFLSFFFLLLEKKKTNKNQQPQHTHLPRPKLGQHS